MNRAVAFEAVLGGVHACASSQLGLRKLNAVVSRSGEFRSHSVDLDQ